MPVSILNEIRDSLQSQGNIICGIKLSCILRLKFQCWMQLANEARFPHGASIYMQRFRDLQFVAFDYKKLRLLCLCHMLLATKESVTLNESTREGFLIGSAGQPFTNRLHLRKHYLIIMPDQHGDQYALNERNNITRNRLLTVFSVPHQSSPDFDDS
ncbi:hypothetical protein HNY73_001716 [Argiope bruennichi]|uniref:Uncharacterized protein n=1 Tax=Argiope bruennichi TaxID=94029 RepID=A0A8T0FS80_ARGBR|nr:hypothetical protein HNY73_001716 [Argiope bruennichi]